jgi:hypothetical protein
MLERGVFVIWGETAQPPTRKDTEQRSKIPNAILRISASSSIINFNQLDAYPQSKIHAGMSCPSKIAYGFTPNCQTLRAVLYLRSALISWSISLMRASSLRTVWRLA